MKIHNKLEYFLNGEKVVTYNTMLKNVFTNFQDLSPYFNYLCIGSSRVVNSLDMTTLQGFIGAFKMSLSNYNINTNNGELYITKSATVKALSPVSVSEVGVSKNADGSGLVNRFVLASPLEIGAGEEFLLTVTINLEIETENSNMCFLTGDNVLIGAILGHDFSEGESRNFSYLKGYNRIATFEPVDYKYLSAEGSAVDYTASLSSDGMKISFNIAGAVPNDGPVTEAIIAFCGSPVLRVSNYDITDTVTLMTETVTADPFRNVRLTNPYVKEVVEVYDTTSDAIVIDTDLISYGLHFGNVNYSPFGEFDYVASAERILSPDGNAIAFLIDGRLDYYEVYYGGLLKRDCSNINLQYMKDIRMINKIILVRCYNPELERHYTDYYYLSGNTFVLGEFSLPWGSLESSLWNIFRLNKCNAPDSYIIGIVTDTDTYMGYLVQSEDKTTLTGTIYYSLGIVLDKFYLTSGSLLEDAYGLGYKVKGDDKGAYVFKSTGYHKRTETAVLNLLQNYGCKRIYAYNGYFYSTYDDKILSPYCRILYFCDTISKTGNVSIASAISRTFWSVDGRYSVELGSSIMNVRYVNGDKTRTMFKSSFPSVTIPLATVDDIEIVGNIMLVFRKDGLSTISLPIIENYSIVAPCREGDSIEVKYNVVNLPGANKSSLDLALRLDVHI